jgi:alkanesulfonate monooxygenase SsuD/methylene tetrahydromethanopterin reductase-like flavin-dependent oxidoreductase (luciferase family)
VTVRFGFIVGQSRPFEEQVADWLLIERLGFDNGWLIDHVAPEFAPTAKLFEAWTTLAAIAARTTTIRIGTAITNVALRNPGLLAKQAITVDQISGGRLEMGVGAGFYESEQRMLGIEYPDAAGRARRLREAVQVFDTGLRGEPVGLDGEFWKLDRLPMAPGPVQQPRPPLWIAASRAASLRTAAEYADVLMTMGEPDAAESATLPMLRDRFARFDALATEAGRAPAELRRAYLVGWADDRPFEGGGRLAEFVGAFADVGVTDFIFGIGAAREHLEELAALRAELGNREAVTANNATN